MPFTLAHPAAALPVWRASGHRLRLAALAIGAMTPDFPYFLHLTVDEWIGHTLLGLFVFDLPAGWLTLWLFDRWGRRGAARLLPHEWVLPHPPPFQFVPVTLAILIGAGTHLLWDAFTHDYGWGLHMLVNLSGSAPPPWWLVTILEDGSTLVGLAYLAWAAYSWARRQPAPAWGPPLRRITLLLAILAVVGVLNGLRVTDGHVLGDNFRRMLVGGGVAVTLALGLSLLVMGIPTGPKVLTSEGPQVTSRPSRR